MTIHNRRLKTITFTLGGTSFECQVREWNLDPGEEDGDMLYSFCPTGEDREETDPEPTLEVTFFSDWRSGGISDYLWTNGGQTVGYVLDHHPDIPEEHTRFSGQLKIKRPAVGGEARTTEVSEVTFALVGLPDYERVPA